MTAQAIFWTAFGAAFGIYLTLVAAIWLRDRHRQLNRVIAETIGDPIDTADEFGRGLDNTPASFTAAEWLEIQELLGAREK